MKTTVVPWGNSQAARLPKTILDRLDLAIGDSIEPIEHQIQITNVKKDSSIPA